MTASTSGVYVDDNVLEVLTKSELKEFIPKFVFQLQIRRFEHFSHIRDRDMMELGLHQDQIKRLRDIIFRISRELWNRSEPKQVFVASDISSLSQGSNDERTVIPNDQVKLFEKLGEGSFAVVKRGIWTQSDGRKIDVAVKILRDISPTVMEDLKVEASHLLKLQHPSLIRLHGIVHNPAMMVFELCEGGSLLDRLRDDKKPVSLVTQLLEYCIQIAKALQFLESKHCVHRDVAARNILLSRDEKTVKICDFGLMRALKDNEQMYTMAPQKKVPFAWCPPEALKHRKFSHASDVWSYGVTVWEIFTFGEEPWAGCRAIDVLKIIDGGERLEKPKYCSQKVYEMMLNCWKPQPDHRITFGAIREDLKAATFLKAVVREPFKSNQSNFLQLNASDEIIVIENTGQDWYGQQVKSKHFGFFPRTCVFVQSNNAVTPAVAITPQKLPTIAPVTFPTTKPAEVVKRPSNNSNNPSTSSRISMPVQGSFIHTGHGDPLGGQSWGSPSLIDDMYLKNPVKGAPMVASNGADIIASKSLLINGGKNVAVASSFSNHQTRLSLDLSDLADDFERACNDTGFSPSSIEYPRELDGFQDMSTISVHKSDDFGINLSNPSRFPGTSDVRHSEVLKPKPIVEKPNAYVPKSMLIAPTNSGVVNVPLPETFFVPQSSSSSATNKNNFINTQPRHVQSTGSRLDGLANNNNIGNYSQKNFSNGNLPQNLIPELKNRLDFEQIRPRPVSSTDAMISSSNRQPNFPNVTRPSSALNLPSSSNNTLPISTLPCLIPTPAPTKSISSNHVAVHSAQTQSDPLKVALANELKNNVIRKPSDVHTNSSNRYNGQANSNSTVNPYGSQGNRPTAPTTTTNITQQQPTRISHPINVQQSVENHNVSRQPSANTSVPKQSGPPVDSSVRIPAATTTNKPTTTVSEVVPRRNVPTTSDEERRSQIIAEVKSALPAPSALLSRTLSTTQSTTSITTSIPSSSNISKPSNSQPTVPQPVKKVSEPVLSMSVLQPIPLPSASIVVRNNSNPNFGQTQNSAPHRTRTPPVAIEKKTTLPQEQAQVPLFNITNSNNIGSFYPNLNQTPNYANGCNGYNAYNPYSGYNLALGQRMEYNPYMSQMQNNPMAYSQPITLPPLISENRSSPVITQPLPESDILQFLPSQPTTTREPKSKPSTSSTLNSMVEKMESLYREANFTERGNCDTMVTLCNGDTDMALRKLKMQYLVDIGVAKTLETALIALNSNNFNISEAANHLLG